MFKFCDILILHFDLSQKGGLLKISSYYIRLKNHTIHTFHLIKHNFNLTPVTGELRGHFPLKVKEKLQKLTILYVFITR